MANPASGRDPHATVVAALQAAGRSHDRTGRLWQCPAHEDHRPSLRVTRGEDRVLVHCLAGCDPRAVVDALGLSMLDLFVSPATDGMRKFQTKKAKVVPITLPTKEPAVPARVVARYPYVDEHGELLAEKERLDPKSFRWRVPDGRGGYVYKLGETKRVPYRLPEVRAAVTAGDRIWVVDGERDVESIRALRQVATCAPDGMASWCPSHAETLRGAEVWIVRDRDGGAGAKQAEDLRALLLPLASHVRIVEAAAGKDITDHLTAGHSLEDVIPVIGHPRHEFADLLTEIAFSSEIRSESMDLDPSAPRTPRWPSSIHEVDVNDLMAGFYGVTLLTGSSGQGKSMVALGSAIEAARSGWRVIYYDAENEGREIGDRITRYTGQHERVWTAELSPLYTHRKFRRGMTLRHLADETALRIESTTAARLLLVIDSANKLAEYTARETRGMDYFGALAEIYLWALAVRDLSRGRIGFIILNEANRDGAAKGRRDYDADVSVQIKATHEHGVVEIDVIKSRQGGAGSLGRYVRDWRRCRFERMQP